MTEMISMARKVAMWRVPKAKIAIFQGEAGFWIGDAETFNSD